MYLTKKGKKVRVTEWIQKDIAKKKTESGGGFSFIEHIAVSKDFIIWKWTVPVAKTVEFKKEKKNLFNVIVI